MSTDPSADLDRLEAKCAALKAERDALAGELERLRGQLRGAQPRAEALLRGLTDAAPVVIYVKDLDGRFMVSNRLHAELLGKQPAQIIGAREHDLLGVEEADEIAAVTAAVLGSGQPAIQEFCLELVGGPRWFHEQIFPLDDGQGRVFAVAGIATDITRRRTAEEEVRALQAEVIAAQSRALSELSAPLMQLAPGVITIPLIGDYDRARSDHMIEVLMTGIVSHRARHVILDFTGLRGADDSILATIGRVTRLARMLGAGLVLTGVSPALAMIMVRAEIELSEVRVESTMGEGLARVLGARGATIERAVQD